MTTPTPQQVLALPMGENDAQATTVGGYLLALLRGVWEKEDKFSGKRPFGNSSWKHEVYLPLVQAGFVSGKVDPEEGWLNEADDAAADALVLASIDALLAPQASPE